MAKGEDISDVAKNTALGVVISIMNVSELLLSLPHRFSDFTLERPKKAPTLSIL